MEYTELIILNDKGETEFADAKYDGVIDILDVTQTELIIFGREKKLTFLDSRGEAEHKVVGVSSGLAAEKILLPVMSERPVIGKSSKPDPEAILSLTPDIVIT